MKKTLIITEEDQLSPYLKFNSKEVSIEKDETVQDLILLYSVQNKIPPEFIVIILNDQILSRDVKLEQGKDDQIQIKDVRTMYKELKQHLQKGTVLREEVKNKNESQIKLEQDLKLAQDKIRQQDWDITYYQNNLNQLEKQNLLLEQLLEQTKTQFNDAFGSRQKQYNQSQSQKQNEYLNSRQGDKKQFINQHQQQIQEANETIDGYNQYLNNINQECLQSFGQQYQPGLFIYYKNYIENFQLEANQAIDQLQKEKLDQEETILKNKTDSNKKYNKLLNEKQNLESEQLSLNDIIEKDKKNYTRVLQENDALKRKLKQAEEDLDSQLVLQGLNEEQKQQKLTDQIKFEGEKIRLTKIEQDYQQLSILFKQKSDEHKKLQEECETKQNSLNEQVTKLQTDLKNSEKIKKQAELKLDSTGKQSQQQIQSTQLQLELDTALTRNQQFETSIQQCLQAQKQQSKIFKSLIGKG